MFTLVGIVPSIKGFDGVQVASTNAKTAPEGDVNVFAIKMTLRLLVFGALLNFVYLRTNAFQPMA